MRTWSSLVVLAIVLFLSACQLTEPGTNVTVPPPSGITPIILTDTFPTPTLDTDITDEQGGETGPGGIATGAPAFGDIVFVRGSQIWTVGADSTNERAILILPDGVELNDVSVSPGGRFTAYLASGSLTILDAETGEQDTFSDPGSLAIDPLVWTPDASALYTSRLITDTISGLPARSQLWRIPLPVGPDPQLVTETEFTADGDVVPVLAVNDTILVIEVGRSEIGQQFLYNSISSAQDVIPLAEGFYVWDISTDGALALLFDRDALLTSVSDAPLPLYLGTVSLTNGLSDITPISPEDLTGKIENARFSPDRSRIAATRTIRTEAGLTQGLVIFTPDGAGGYVLTSPGADATRQDIAFGWLPDGTALVVQRLPLFNAPSEIWIVPVDGSEPRFLTNGENPLVVGGR